MRSTLRIVVLLILAACALYFVLLVGLAHLGLLPGSKILRALLYGLGPLAALILIPRIIFNLFATLYHVRYIQGDGPKALQLLKLLKFLMGVPEYQQMRFSVLLEQGKLDEAQAVLDAPPPQWAEWKRLYLRHSLCLQLERFEEAETLLRQAVALVPASDRILYKLDLAVFLAQRRPQLLQEACHLFDEAMQENGDANLKTLLRGLQGLLFIVGGQAHLGQEILQRHLPMVKGAGITLRPWLGLFMRWNAWAEWAQGNPELAHKSLLDGRALMATKSYPVKFDRDLQKLADHFPLFPEPGEEIKAFMGERAQRRQAIEEAKTLTEIASDVAAAQEP